VESAGHTEILAADAAAALAGGDAVLLDVREGWEWEAGRIADGLHVPMGELATRLAEVPTDRPLVVACRSGVRSDAVAAALRDAGISALNLVGGLQAWAAAGLPLEPAGGHVA
jgi:rhodanese-related sulfurtransferase